MVAKKKKESGLLKRVLLTVLLLIVIIIGYKGFQIYQEIKRPNVTLKGKEVEFLYIPTGSVYEDVTAILYENEIILDKTSFEWVAKKKNYPANVKPGKYKISKGMSNEALVNMLRSGNQHPVKVVFNNIRTKDKLAGIISRQIEADSVKILRLLNNNQFLQKYKLTKETAMCLFIPNTYELYWNTSAEEFIDRMYKEYQKFWNTDRLNKAKAINKTPVEVITIASIVQEETNNNDEKPKLAAVYLNRLKKGMRLQACPTVKFALNDFEIKRILTKHLETESPYNTYTNDGLPPGPICIPSISTIDAVLKNVKHNYLYFCAKDDFSGTHAFASTLEQHNQNAAKYQKALNENKIYR